MPHAQKVPDPHRSAQFQPWPKELWQQARRLYGEFRGQYKSDLSTFRMISERTGIPYETVQIRAKNEKWKLVLQAGGGKTLTDAQRQILSARQEKKEGAVSDLTVGYKRWKNLVRLDLEKTADAISRLAPAEDREELLKHERIMELHLKRGEETFGIHDNRTNTVINIAVMKANDTAGHVEVPIEICEAPTMEQLPQAKPD